MDSDFSSCPWHQTLDKAAYAAQALVAFLDAKQGFASPFVQTIFQYRSGFAFKLPAAPFIHQPLEPPKVNWLSAVLAKIAQRGLPAPCSLNLERHLLKHAQSVDLLSFRDEISGGAYHFRLNPGLPFKQNFKPFVYAALYPELFIEDENIEEMIRCYLSISTPLEQELFNRLRSRFSDPRLALFVVPKRRMEYMLPGVFRDCQYPDFSIEVPSLYKNYCLRFILEADDSKHLEMTQQQIERNRDQRIINAGWQIKRFRISESGSWDASLDRVAELLHAVITPDLLDAAYQLRSLPIEQKTALQNLVALPMIEAQLSVTLAHYLREYGTAQLEVSDPLHIGLVPVIEAINDTLRSLVDLVKLKNVGEVNLVDENVATPHLSIFPTPIEAQWKQYALQQGGIGPCVVRHEYIASLWSAKPQALEIASTNSQQHLALEYLLANIFRKVKFREGQLPILSRALSLRPVIGLLPTGAGKSLCYQLASLLQPGFSLVIDPLRSLMQDQRNNLQEIGIHRCKAIGSSSDLLDVQVFQKSMSDKHYLFVFLSPECLQVQSLRTVLSSIAASFPVVYCVIDEAHCVSEWGHDFRPSYLKVSQRIRNYCKYDSIQPSVLALTGTASRNVLTDILKELQTDEQATIVEPISFNREELQFEVIRVNNNNRIFHLADQLDLIFNQTTTKLQNNPILNFRT